MNTVQLFWKTSDGSILLDIITDVVKLEWARKDKVVGAMTLVVNPDDIPEDLLIVDARVEIWRKVDELPAYLEGDTVWFLQDWAWDCDEKGTETLQLLFYDALMIIDGAIVAYESDGTEAINSGEIDDSLKTIVKENLGALATDTTRDISAFMTVQRDLTQAPAKEKAFSRRNVLTVLKEYCEVSDELGTYLTFDVVLDSTTRLLQFRTYILQRGLDRTIQGSAVILSKDLGNLSNVRLTISHSKERNYIYAGGQGAGADRVIKTAFDSIAMHASPFRRKELFVDARNVITDDSIQTEADTALEKNKAVKIITGKIVDTDTFKYGKDYFYGDRVLVQHRNVIVSAVIDAIHVTVEKGSEVIDNYVKGEV